jgi:hypothetical protein
MTVQRYVTNPRRAAMWLAASTVLAPISLWWLLMHWVALGMSTETSDEMDRVYSAGNPQVWMLGAIGIAISGGVCAA